MSTFSISKQCKDSYFQDALESDHHSFDGEYIDMEIVELWEHIKEQVSWSIKAYMGYMFEGTPIILAASAADVIHQSDNCAMLVITYADNLTNKIYWEVATELYHYEVLINVQRKINKMGNIIGAKIEA